MFFVLGAALASMGPGNIATAALLAPLAMATAARTGIPLFLMAIMVGNGANAGALSPFAPTGIIVNGIMARNGLPGLELQTYLYNLLAHALVAFGGYALFGGLKLFARATGHSAGDRPPTEPPDGSAERPFDRRHWITLGVDRRAHPERASSRRSTSAWRVCRRGHSGADAIGRRWRGDQADAVAGDRDGVRRHGADLAGRAGAGHRTAGLAGCAESRRANTVTGVVAFLTGDRVGLQQHLGRRSAGVPADGAGARRGAARRQRHRDRDVDEHRRTPRRRVAALDDRRACAWPASAATTAAQLFNQLLAWGLSMAVVGALLCYVLF